MPTPFPNASHDSLTRYLCSPSWLPGGRLCAERMTGLESHIVLGDAIEVLSALPDNCVDLVHTSPPYNIDRPYESSASDKNPLGDYVTFLQSSITELKRVVRPGGSIFWQTGYTQGSGDSREIIPIDLLSYQVFQSAPNRFLLWDRIIWRYWGGHAFTRKFTNKHETIMWYVKPGAEPVFSADAVRERAKEYDKRNNFWGRNPGNVWEVDRVAFGAIEQTSHIAVFPEEITERIVRACSEPGDLVLDPFAGSGTVPKVAHSLGRRWLGVEISPVYAAEAAIRVGYQQPSESDSLASELIKKVGFDGKRDTLRLGELRRRMSAWASEVQITQLEEVLPARLGVGIPGRERAQSDQARRLGQVRCSAGRPDRSSRSSEDGRLPASKLLQAEAALQRRQPLQVRPRSRGNGLGEHCQ